MDEKRVRTANDDVRGVIYTLGFPIVSLWSETTLAAPSSALPE